MNNFELIKNFLKNCDDEFYKMDTDNPTIDDIISLIDGDCCICLFYGCRNFTNSYRGKHISKKECEDFMRSYLSRDFNPDTDNCQCPACRKHRNEDNDIHKWRLSYKDIVYYIDEYNLPEAKSHAVNDGIFNEEDYPYINGIIVDNE